MVSWLSILFMVVTILFSVFFPAGLAVYMYRKKKIFLRAVFIGALMFFIFQGVLRIPALVYIQGQDWFIQFMKNSSIAAAIIIAFSAALFETAGRYIGLKFLLKDKLNRENAIAYGIGHGGIEAILLVGVTYILNLYYSILINTKALNNSITVQLVTTPSDLFLAAGVERFFTILFHIAMALIVAYGIMKNNKIYIIYCVLLHTLTDSLAVILSMYKVAVWGIEGVIAIIGILSLVFIIKSKNIFDDLNSENERGGGDYNETV